MRSLFFRASAQRDLRAIQRYIAKASGQVASGEGFALQLVAQCARLAALPGTLGRARPELRADLRSVSVKGYSIFFEYTDDALVVVAIVNGQRDMGALFQRDR